MDLEDFSTMPESIQGHYTEGAELIDSVLDVVRCLALVGARRI